MLRRHRAGSVLILVSWILILLVAVSATLARTAHVELEASRRGAAGLEARAIAESGVERALAFLASQSRASSGVTPTWRDDPSNFQEVELGRGAYSLYYLDPIAAGRKYGIYEEASKLNLNLASAEMLAGIVEYVMSASRITWSWTSTEVAAAIVDFRDADSTPLEGGAESEYYATLLPPYEPKNGPFESVAELLLVRGIDERLLLGEDANRNGRLDAAEDDGESRWPPDDSDGVLAPGLIHYLTVYSYDRNETATGEARVNLASASDDAVRDALVEVLAPEKVAGILRFKRRPGFGSIGQLVDVPELTGQDVQAVIDLVTTSDEEIQYGLVDVVTAPREVLAVLPGLDDEKAAALVDRRSGSSAGLDTIGWMLEAIDPDSFRTVASFVTAKSYQYEVASLGEVDGGAVFHRVRAVVDLGTGDGPPRFLHYQDETWLGPVLAASERTGSR